MLTAPNPEQEWKIRLGQAGNIYSFVGPTGETVPPQDHNQAPWVDEVWQQVQPLGPGGDNDWDPDSNAYFIHEAGTYQRDPSPTGGATEFPCGLVLQRSGGQCSGPDAGGRYSCPLVAQDKNLGAAPNKGDGGFPVRLEGVLNGVTQQKIDASIRHWCYNCEPNGRMYFYCSDCADVNEVNAALPANAEINVYTQDDANTQYALTPDCFDYTIPPFYSPTLGAYCKGIEGECGFMSWVRNKDSSDMKNESTHPSTSFPTSKLTFLCLFFNSHPLQGQQAHLPTPWKSPMLYLNRYVNCGNGVIEYTQLRHNNVGSPDTFTYTNVPWGAVRTTVLPDVVMTNSETNSHEIITLQNWGAESLILPLSSTLGYTMFAQSGVAEEDKLSLGHVYGTTAAGSGSYPRVRAGKAANTARDFTVYTINTTPTISPGDTYSYRQYFIMDKYTEMATKGPMFAPEAIDDKYPAGGKVGRTIKLYSDLTGSAFGFSIDVNGCTAPGATEVCSGSTTPQVGSKALFQVQCGSESVVTNNPYYFTPDGYAIEGGTVVRSYQCKNLAKGERPVWKLLGFFNAANCDTLLDDKQFDEGYCFQSTVQ